MMKLDIQFFSDDDYDFPEEDFPESNMNIGFPEVTYTKIYSGNEVTQIKAEVRVPATDTGVSGYVKLGSISGWTLSDNDTKLTKTYTFNQTETITLTYISFNGVTFDNVTNMEVIEIYDIDGSKYIRTNVEYTRASDGSANVLTHATVIVSLKDSYVGSYKISTNNAEWVVSSDGTSAQKDVYVNDTFLNTIGIYPAGETESDSNRILENFTYRISCVGLTVADAEVTLEEKKSDNEVIGTKVKVKVPYTLDGKTGYATLGNVDGWVLSENKKELSKNFLDNATETISIPVIEANGYVFGSLSLNENITVDAINFKRVVKGRCDITRCLYDVYTKAETENFKLKLEQEFEESRADKNGKVLWKNDNPTSAFLPQNIQFNSGDYDVLEWVFCTNERNEESTWSKARKGDSVLLSTVSGGTSIKIRTRICTRVSDTEYSISVGREFTGLNTSGTEDNAKCIPLYVIGYKTGLL